MGLELTILLISLMLVSSQVYMLRFFLKKISKIEKDLQKLRLHSLHSIRPGSKQDVKLSAKMIEGEIDLVFKGRKASLKAIFYPKKIV